jgi:hypothetical protein
MSLSLDPPCHFINRAGFVICTMSLGPEPPEYYSMAILTQPLRFPTRGSDLNNAVTVIKRVYRGRKIRQRYPEEGTFYFFVEVY